MSDMEDKDEIIPKTSTSMLFTSENRSRTTSIVENLVVDFHTSISSVTPSLTNNINVNDDDIPLFTVRQIYKNLSILAISFLLIFTAYDGISVLQSSLNTKGNVGINSLIVMNAVASVSTLNRI